MKNNVVKIIMSFSLVALCFATLAFGVFAAVERSSSMDGSVGFTAEDVNASISIYVYNAVKEDESAYPNLVLSNFEIDADIETSNSVVPFENGIMYFDESKQPAVADIVFEFLITNNNKDIAITASGVVSSLLSSLDSKGSLNIAWGTKSSYNTTAANSANVVKLANNGAISPGKTGVLALTLSVENKVNAFSVESKENESLFNLTLKNVNFS